jgi:hypothetical protein
MKKAFTSAVKALVATAVSTGLAEREKTRSGEIDVATKSRPIRAAPPLEVARKKALKASGTISSVLLPT